MSVTRGLCVTLFLSLFLIQKVASIDYSIALSKSILYYEAQRSGKLPQNQRVDWRGDSGLSDGSDAGIDLVGGYYDAGDNVKFSFPMAYTTTMLGWSVVEFQDKLSAKNELKNALAAIRWGTDYIIKAHTEPNVLYGEVGEPSSDHQCWERPEDMDTPRTSYKIDESNPGSDLAGESAAALAAASIVFAKSDAAYSSQLLTHAKQLFDFARNHQGVYTNSISVASGFYSSSGFQDELIWAAAWLFRATDDQTYLKYIDSSGGSGGVRTMFSWDDKYVGVQTLVAKLIIDGKVDSSEKWASYKSQAEEFICNCIQKGNNNVKRTPGGLTSFNEWNNVQYVTSSSFIAAVYSKYKQPTIQCQGGLAKSEDLAAFVKSQADYILGMNPKSMSYMVGFGSSFPTQVHHRGASIVSIKKDPTHVECKKGFDDWFYKNAANPNVLEGALVGGPHDSDEYSDSRSNYQQAEPATANNAPFIGVLAYLS